MGFLLFVIFYYTFQHYFMVRLVWEMRKYSMSGVALLESGEFPFLENEVEPSGSYIQNYLCLQLIISG